MSDPAVVGLEASNRALSEDGIRRIAQSAAAEIGPGHVLAVIPDGTRSGPLPQLFEIIADEFATHGITLDWIIALGTHAPMSAAAIDAHVGMDAKERARRYPGTRVFNHDPKALTVAGRLERTAVASLTGGLLNEPIEVTLATALAGYDAAVVVGPVFPHEVVGFSGGNKYFVPGLAGQEIIDTSHWLGALIGSRAIIGVPGPNPVRALIDAAADMVPVPRRALAYVVRPEGGLAGLWYGSPERAWDLASHVAARTLVGYEPEPWARAICVVPLMYPDMWTAAKAMYKVDPVIADGGEIIIYAPHITEFAAMHPQIDRVGYHCLPYIQAHLADYTGIGRGVLAHSTHLRGAGSYDGAVEHDRIAVTLATGISRARCEAANLGYLDPTIAANLLQFPDKLDKSTHIVEHAGEFLYRLAPAGQ